MSESHRSSSDPRNNHFIHRVIPSEGWALIANTIFDLAESSFSCDVDANFADTFCQNPKHSRLEATRLFNIAPNEEKEERDSCVHNHRSFFRMISILWLYVAKFEDGFELSSHPQGTRSSVPDHCCTPSPYSMLYTTGELFGSLLAAVFNLSPSLRFLPTM